MTFRRRARSFVADLGSVLNDAQARRVALDDPALLGALLASAPFTLVDASRRANLWRLVSAINRDGTEGDIVEAGTYRGGTAAILAAASLRSGRRRLLWLYDSFQGLPETTERDDGRFHAGLQWHANERKASTYRGGERLGRLVGSTIVRGSLDDVRRALAAVQWHKDDARIIPGWFQDTLPQHPDRAIALIHVDADWYESTKIVLETLYDRLSVDGFVIIDDYGKWIGCARATDDFREARGIRTPLERWGAEQVFWRKAASS